MEENNNNAAVAPAAVAKDYEDESLVFAAIMEKAGLYSLQVRKRCTNSQTLTQCYTMQLLLDLQIQDSSEFGAVITTVSLTDREILKCQVYFSRDR